MNRNWNRNRYQNRKYSEFLHRKPNNNPLNPNERINFIVKGYTTIGVDFDEKIANAKYDIPPWDDKNEWTFDGELLEGHGDETLTWPI